MFIAASKSYLELTVTEQTCDERATLTVKVAQLLHAELKQKDLKWNARKSLSSSSAPLPHG